ncbi:antibiotic biosynthesis monooxygenase family protein [Micromonospora sp. DT53]|uniref:antibiotic biosynthesis monooxygenase family protein n=1 Tax=Micromonospora sp. DT53 TaxID=3393444 RepID=UPI003CEFF0EE
MSNPQRFDATGSGVVTFVNTFSVHGSPDDFERVFADISEFMASQPGFIQYTLSRHIDADKQNRFVNIALWTDVESWRNAITHPEFEAHAKEIRTRCTNEANMYTPRQSYSVR